MSVPALRFNEFSSCWIKKKLGEVSTYTKGFAFKSDDYQENGTRIVRVSDLTASAIKQDNQMIFIDSLKAAKYSSYKLNNGDIVITTVGSKPELFESAVGRGILITKNDEGLLNQNLLKLNSSEKMNNSFLFRQINSERYIAHIKNIQRGNANQSNITLKDLFEFDVFIAESKEQTKVANFLTAVDEKITQLTQKHDLLTQYKKGVMQQIFCQELRFRDDDGQDFPEWEDKLLGQLCSITTGKLDANAMVADGQYRFYTCAREYYQIDKYAFDTEALLISGNGANVGYIHYYKGKFNAYQRTYVLDNFEQNIIFVKYFLDEFLHVRIFKEAKEGNTPYIVMGTLTDMEIKIPPLPEQTKIANFLTAIDEKITATQTQLQAVKQYKQGLLQQMFV